jgi:hypothetical protein
VAKAHDPRTFLVLAEINRCLLVLDRVKHMKIKDSEKLRCAQDMIEFRDLPVYAGEEVIGMRRRVLSILETIAQEVAVRDPIELARQRISDLAR